MPLKIATPMGKSISSAEPAKGWHESDYQPPLLIPNENRQCTYTHYRFPRNGATPHHFSRRLFVTCRKETHEQAKEAEGVGRVEEMRRSRKD